MTGAPHPVRRARAEDFSALRPLYAELMWGLENVSDDPADWEATLASGQVFVSLADGIPAAMATLHVHPMPGRTKRAYAFVENVATLPAWRGQGHGRAAMEACAAAAGAQGAYKICLLTMREGGARGFYEALGYVADERWGMALRLPAPGAAG